jgi:predicted RNase H-like HicB family nuclease
MSTYTREGNSIYFTRKGNSTADRFKVAVINAKGYLQPAKGMADHRAAVEAFLEADRIPDEDIALAPAAEGGFIAEVTHVPGSNGQGETQQQARDSARSAARDLTKLRAETGEIPPCPPEDPAAGDKTPAVIAWWHRYHPEAAAVKYRGRKFAMPDAE